MKTIRPSTHYTPFGTEIIVGSAVNFVKLSDDLFFQELEDPMISFKGVHYPKDIFFMSGMPFLIAI